MDPWILGPRGNAHPARGLFALWALEADLFSMRFVGCYDAELGARARVALVPLGLSRPSPLCFLCNLALFVCVFGAFPRNT